MTLKLRTRPTRLFPKDLVIAARHNSTRPMPQDSVQQAIVRGAIRRIAAGVPVTPATSDQDQTIVLSGIERGVILEVLGNFVAIPAEPTGR